MTIDRHPNSLRGLIRDQLVGSGWEVVEVSYESINELDSIPLEEIDAVLLAPARFLPKKFMLRLTNCKIVQIWSSGFDKFNIADAHALGLLVANNHGSNAISVAEHTMMMMLGVSRRAPEMHTRVVTGNWAGNDHGMSSFSLAGKTLGIVGLGNIGSHVAHRAEAFGMKVVFADPHLTKPAKLEWARESFDRLLALSDYITFHVHLNTETRGMLSLSKLGLLEKRPFVINVSRAEIIEKRAALYALQADLIKGLAMDAHYDEPSKSEDSLFSYENTLFSPHVAGSTRDSYRDTLQSCIHNMGEAIRGGPVRGILRNEHIVER